MKPFKFKTKATVLKGVKEEAPKRKTNWDRVIYMLLFLFIFLSVLYYAISKNFYVNVWGHVHTEQFSVQFPEDVSVYNYFVGEDDTVEKGDTLFYYRQNMQDDDNSGGAAVAAVVTNSSDWYLKERLQTQKKISLDYIAIEDQKNNIARIKKEIEKTKKEVYLDVYPQAELKKVMLDMDKYYVEIDKLKQEITYLKRYLSLLNYYEQQAKINNQPVINTGNGDVILWNYYVSPIDGVVSKIFQDPKEVTYKKDIVMYMNNTDEVFILAYINEQDIDYFSLDEKLSLHFADGSTSEGVIERFYINTEELPLDFVEPKARYKRRIVMRLVPENEDAVAEWKKLNLFEVRITKTRYF
jgi:hypothetical protein